MFSFLWLGSDVTGSSWGLNKLDMRDKLNGKFNDTVELYCTYSREVKRVWIVLIEKLQRQCFF